MSTPSNPGWATGYVPSSAEWNATWSGKVDYPAPVSQGGTGGVDAVSGNYNLQQRSEITTSPTQIAPLAVYSLRTDISSLTLALPPLSATKPGDWLLLVDSGDNANVNPVLVEAAESEVIFYNGAQSNTLTLQNSGAQYLFTASDAGWRVTASFDGSASNDLSNVVWSDVSDETLTAMFNALKSAGLFDNFLGT